MESMSTRSETEPMARYRERIQRLQRAAAYPHPAPRVECIETHISWVLLAGADGLMVGDYLTTRGRGWDDDFRMIEDAGLRVPPHPRRRAARP